VIDALRINAKITADPAKPIAGPVKTKIAPRSSRNYQA